METLIKTTFKTNYFQKKLITKEIEEYLSSILKRYPNFKNFKNIVFAIKHDISFDLYTCMKCGKHFSFNKNNITGICGVCKMKQTQKSEECKEKIRKTCLEKYGVDHPWKSKEIKEKIKSTNLERYGSEHASQNIEVKRKQIETCQEKYGTNSPTQVKEIKEKQIKTCLKNFGVENIFQKFSKSEEFQNMRRDQLWNSILAWKQFNIIPLFERYTLEKLNSGKIYKWKCVKCGNEFKSHIHKTMHISQVPYLPRCLKCYPYLNGTSNKENEIIKFCKQYFPNLKEKCHQLIKPLELDIVIDELKLAIEFNGSYWHSTQGWLNKHKVLDNYHNYHLNKVIKCNKKGYRLIHIWEDEWDNNKELIKQKLVDIFTNKEIIDYSDKLDRSWYNNLSGNFEELPPKIIKRNCFDVENCGYLVYIKNMNM